MANGYSRSPKLLKGALVQFSAPMLVPIPNVIIFQYNPESLSRGLNPWAPPEKDEDSEKVPKLAPETAQPYDPEETISLSLELDATDDLEEPETHPVAVLSGIATRIAAIEMLCYPSAESLLGGLLSGSVQVSIGGGGISASAGGGAAVEAVPRPTVPVVLFIWGPGLIVPVRITDYSIDEQMFNTLLYPVRAKVSLKMKVLTPAAFPSTGRTLTEDIAVFAYDFTRAQKEVLALANVANSVESILGMLPF